MQNNTAVAGPPPPHGGFQFNSPEMDSLPIPPLDPHLFSDLGLGFGSGDNFDFDLSFDDLDDLDMSFLVPEEYGSGPTHPPPPPPDSSSPGGSSAVVSIAADHDSSANSVGPTSSVATCGNSGNSGGEIARNRLGKRKKEEESHHHDHHHHHQEAGHVEEEEKRRARLIRNRESAQLSRQRRKHYVEELEEKVRSMHSTISQLNSRITYITAENAALKHQLSGIGIGVGVGGAMYPPPMPYPPMPYPWGAYSPYAVNPQGSKVVPIPRLRPENSESKKKKRKGSEGSSGRTKKVASISFLGLLFFVLLFGGIVPMMMNASFGGLVDISDSTSRLYEDEHRGRVLSVHGHLNGSEHRGIYGGKFDGGSEKCGSDNFFGLGNNTSSDPLVASLYVPRNDGLVRIDGNLIIHSVLASEKAKASPVSALAIPGGGGRRGPLARNYYGPHNALTAGSAGVSNDRVKSSGADGELQQWFREGLAGPMLSSGMCTEVFQFDVSAAIIPASSVSNVSEHRQNSTQLNMGRNRRILRALPSSDHNVTEENVTRNHQNENLAGNRSASSMVVSVLVDPREAVDTEVDGMIKPKSLSRIFVVVLLDSVKYVTYSCVLPRSGPHLVTT